MDLAQKDTEKEDATEFERTARINALGVSLAKKRDKAVNHRKSTGIEAIWTEDEEFYQGIDDANREDLKITDEQFTTRRRKKSKGSNIFLNITRTYTDIAAASMSDMLLPSSESPFEIQETPIPSIIADSKKSEETVLVNGQETPVKDIALAMIEEARESAAKANTQIEDWLLEADWNGEVRKVIRDAAKIGCGVLKGPLPVKRKSKKITRDEESGEVNIEVLQETKPESKRIDPRNLYPDPDCGESLHDGSYVWEKDYVTAKKLRELKGTKNIDDEALYIEGQIDLILAEGPQKKYADDSNTFTQDDERFEIWYFTGEADSDDIKAAGCHCDDGGAISVTITMVNERVIKAGLNPLDSGEFPYDVMTWQQMADTWTGIGVVRQIRAAQRIINAGTRNLMDNAGKGGSPITVLSNDIEMEGGGQINLNRGAVMRLRPDSVLNAQQAVSSVIIPIISNELMAIIQFALKMAEDVTGLPMLLQGQAGAAPDTVGGMTMMQNNASTIRRNIARTFDDSVTRLHIQRYYEWLLIYSDDEEAKGDFQIVARGSTALFERDAQNLAIQQMGAMVQNPAFGINPQKWIKEMFASQKLDAKRFQYSEEEMQEMQAAAQENPPQDPRVAGNLEVAKVRQQTEMEKAKLNQSSDMSELQLKQQMSQTEHQFKMQQANEDRQLELQLKSMDREIKIMELSQAQNMSIDKIKAELAQTSLRLNTQKDLSLAKDGAPQVARTNMEPVGRAANGRAFEQ